MDIAIGSDHAGFELKEHLGAHLRALGHEVCDLGTYSTESVDYPDFGEAVGRAVVRGDAAFGVVCCGTGIGVSIAANKVAGVRAALVHDATTAHYAKAHNQANVLCFGARIVGLAVGTDALDAYLGAAYEGGRHDRRLEKIRLIEEGL